MESLVLKDGTIVSVNTPDLVTKDVAGKKVSQLGTKEGSFGRPLPGVAVRLVNEGSFVIEPYVQGDLEVIPVGADDWVKTGIRVSIDEEGFLMI